MTQKDRNTNRVAAILRIQGNTYRVIADLLKVTPQEAREAVQAGIEAACIGSYPCGECGAEISLVNNEWKHDDSKLDKLHKAEETTPDSYLSKMKNEDIRVHNPKPEPADELIKRQAEKLGMLPEFPEAEARNLVIQPYQVFTYTTNVRWVLTVQRQSNHWTPPQTFHGNSAVAFSSHNNRTEAHILQEALEAAVKEEEFKGCEPDELVVLFFGVWHAGNSVSS